MTLEEMTYQCKQGKLGLFPDYEGYFKWNYGTNELDYMNYRGSLFPARNLKHWNSIKGSKDFYYII